MVRNAFLAVLFATASSILLSACASLPQHSVAKRPELAELVVGTSWQAQTIGGVIPVIDPRPQLRWPAPGQIAGNGGCNAFVGKVAVQGDAVRFSSLTPVGTPCITAPTGQEDLFFKSLEETRAAQLEGERLTLLDAAGKALAQLARDRR